MNYIHYRIPLPPRWAACAWRDFLHWGEWFVIPTELKTLIRETTHSSRIGSNESVFATFYVKEHLVCSHMDLHNDALICYSSAVTHCFLKEGRDNVCDWVPLGSRANSSVFKSSREKKGFRHAILPSHVFIVIKFLVSVSVFYNKVLSNDNTFWMPNITFTILS